MLIFSIILFIVAIIVRVIMGKTNESKFISIAVAAVAGICLIAAFLTTIPAGHVGIQDVFGSVSTRYLEAGINFKNPFAHIVKMDIRTRPYTMSVTEGEGAVKGNDGIDAPSKDNLSMRVDMTIQYRLIANAASFVYKNFGTAFIDDTLRSTSRTTARDATATFTAMEGYSTKRDQLGLVMGTMLEDSLSAIFKESGYEDEVLAIVSVQLRKVEPPKKVLDAIQEKLREQQAAEKMVFTLQKEEREAERKEIEAKGIKRFQQIVTEGITPGLLQWKGIEATAQLADSPNAKVVVIGSGKNGLPLILGGN